MFDENEECNSCEFREKCISGENYMSDEEVESGMTKLGTTSEEFQRALTIIYDERKIESRLHASIFVTSFIRMIIDKGKKELLMYRIMKKLHGEESGPVKTLLDIAEYVVNELKDKNEVSSLDYCVIVNDMVFPFTKIILNSFGNRAEGSKNADLVNQLRNWYESETADIS